MTHPLTELASAIAAGTADKSTYNSLSAFVAATLLDLADTSHELDPLDGIEPVELNPRRQLDPLDGIELIELAARYEVNPQRADLLRVLKLAQAFAKRRPPVDHS